MDAQDEKSSPRQTIAEWFVSLGLQEDAKSETCITHFMNVFFRNKHLFFIIITFVVIPFLIVPFLFFVNAYTLFPPLPGVEYKEWVSFLGGYLGGFITFGGVFLSVRHMKNAQSREEEIRKIEKEFDILSTAIQNIDPYFCNNIYFELASLVYFTYEQYMLQLQSIQNRINDKIALINVSAVYVNTATEILDIVEKCTADRKPCNLCKIKKEFIYIYDKRIFIRNILVDIQKLVKNKIDTMSIMKLTSDTLTQIESSPEKDFSDSRQNIILLKNSIEDVKNITDSIVINLENIVNDYVLEYFPKMVTLLKLYKHERIKLVAKKCT